MKKFAHIENAKVANLSVCGDDATPPDGCIDVTGLDVAIGDEIVDAGFVRPVPPAPEPAPPRRTIPASEFRDRFTPNEMDAVLALAYGGDAIARRLLFKLQTQVNISLDSPELIDGLAYLVQSGAVSQARADEVLA